jgi:hypothetical protein
MYALVFVLGFVVARMMRGRLVKGKRGVDLIEPSKKHQGTSLMFLGPLKVPQLMNLHKKVLESNNGHKETCDYKTDPLGQEAEDNNQYNYCEYGGGWNNNDSPLVTAVQDESGKNVKLNSAMWTQFCNLDNGAEDPICQRTCNYHKKCKSDEFKCMWKIQSIYNKGSCLGKTGKECRQCISKDIGRSCDGVEEFMKGELDENCGPWKS